MEEAQRCEEGADREAEAAVQLGPAGDGPHLHRRRHQRFLQGEQARRRRLRARLQGRPGRRRGDRGEAAVGEVAAGRGGVPERGGADRQAAAQEPGEAAGVLRGEGREDARLRVPPQPEPRRLPLRRQKDRALGLEDEADHHGGDRARPAVPPRGLVPQDRPQGPQGQQRAPRQQDEPQDLRLRHGHDLRGRGDRGHQHRPRRRNIRVHGAGVRDGGRLLGEVGRVQLRGAGAGDPQRAAQRRNVPPGAPANPHPRRMEDVERGQGGGVHGRVAGRVVRQGRGVAVLPRGTAVRAGEPRAPADHVQRRADAHQRPGAAAGARAAAAVREPEEGPGVGPVLAGHEVRDDVQDAFRQRRVHHHDPAAIEFLLPSSFCMYRAGVFDKIRGDGQDIYDDREDVGRKGKCTASPKETLPWGFCELWRGSFFSFFLQEQLGTL